MDFVAHALWAGAGIALLRRRRVAVGRRDAAAAAACAALPDLAHALPLAAWSLFGGGTPASLVAYALASPGGEPAVLTWVEFAGHHLHCMAHSAIVAAVLSVLLLARRRDAWPLLAGWWSHIVLDVFTHSASYYPSPVLYPLTQRGFDGVAWNEPWPLALNYAALALVALWLLRGGAPAADRHTPAAHRLTQIKADSRRGA